MERKTMLDELCNVNGVSGYESNVINIIYDLLKEEHLDNIYIDNVGNLICYRKGSLGNKKIIVNSHVDEVGFQVISQYEDGKYRIKSLGNIKSWNAVQQKVASQNAYGVIYAKNEDAVTAYNYDNLYLRIFDGGPVNTGDVFAFEGRFKEGEEYYSGKALDNRISCVCLLELIKKNIKTEADIYYIFTVQEEIGMRGSRVAKSTLIPDMCINLDVSAECDMNSIMLSKGVGIKVSDSMGVSCPECVEWVKSLSEANQITYQLEVSDCGTSELIITNEIDNGSKEIGISIPCQFLHSANSIVCKEDVFQCDKLLSVVISNL